VLVRGGAYRELFTVPGMAPQALAGILAQVRASGAALVASAS
jgi:hypothetical protein